MKGQSSLWQRVLTNCGFPATLAAGLGASCLAMEMGATKFIAVTSVLLVVGTVVFLLEWLIPYSREHRPKAKTVKTDLLHVFLSTALVPTAIEAVAFGALVALAAWASQKIGIALWPTELRLEAQFVLALLIAEFGAYWGHRICHMTPLAWRIHAMHHSSDLLYVLSAGRNHPFNVVLTFGVQTVPLILLGASGEILALVAVFTGMMGLFQHANVHIRSGVLGLFLATPELHRWHHSRNVDESNHNFGNNLIVWDRVFGTFLLPSDRPPPAHVGLDDCVFPESFFAQVASPFILHRFVESGLENDKP